MLVVQIRSRRISFMITRKGPLAYLATPAKRDRLATADRRFAGRDASKNGLRLFNC
jgi:hypothetical protein